ncbi:MAG: hypothetical protein JW829_03785 [Pirellulales bacterium]|nr:hypothetical protein [Pirellulales bacterium]
MLIPADPTMLADIGDILGFLVGAVLFVIWLIGQIAGIKQQAKERPAPPPKAPRPPGHPPGLGQPRPIDRPQPAAGQPRPGAAPRPARGPQQAVPNPIANEIEEFLRRAANRRQRGQVEEVEVLVPDPIKKGRPVEAAIVRPAVAVTRPQVGKLGTQPTHVATKPDDSAAELGRGVARHVNEHIGASSFAARTSQLGEDIAYADERLESHLQQTFDHSVSRLVHRVLSPGDVQLQEASPFAESIVKMLQSPESMQQVILLNEILRRPGERW